MPLLKPPSPYGVLEDGKSGFLFTKPERWITAHHPGDIERALQAVEAASADGSYAMGYMRYEAAQAFHPKLSLSRSDPRAPLLCFGIFKAPEILAGPALEAFWQQKALVAPSCSSAKAKPHWDLQTYTDKILTVLEHLAAGDIYQANLTFALDLDTAGSAEALYARLRRNQPAPYSAFLAFEEDLVLSLSPERFFTITGDTIEAQPMKGTAPIGSPSAGDALKADPKNRAENLMITDLLRNDLSQIAERASVEVPALFDIERLPSLYQMTSRVTAKRKAGTSLYDVMTALFPCGSITGAPKLSAMHSIDSLETAPRGIYCGAVGMIKPNGDMTFSVPIRTVTQHAGKTQMSVGSGVVADSKPDQEYKECLLKADFLTAARPAFSLIETMRWDPGAPAAPRYWPLHLARLKDAAAYFGFADVPDTLEAELASLISSLPPQPHKLRLLYSKHGSISLTADPFLGAAQNSAMRVRLGSVAPGTPTDFLRYKTTNRAAYSQALAQAREHGPCGEAFLVGDDGLLTEGSYSNIFVKKAGALLTPRANGAFLEGILRADLLGSGKAVEAELSASDLKTAEAVYAGNALRGLWEVTVIH